MATSINPDFNPTSTPPTPNEFVFVFRLGSFPVVGYYDGFGNWKRLVWSSYDFSWWPEPIEQALGWKPIV
jgi:hypothetical protein